MYFILDLECVKEGVTDKAREVGAFFKKIEVALVLSFVIPIYIEFFVHVRTPSLYKVSA